MPSTSDLTYILTAITAIAAASAAGAAWWTVRQQHEQWLEGRRPHLRSQVTTDVDTGHVSIAVFNLGGGDSLMTMLMFAASGKHICSNLKPHGRLPAGASVTWTTPLVYADDEPAAGVLLCYDVFGQPHAWDAAYSPVEISTGDTVEQVFKRRYPDVATGEAVRSGHTLVP